MTSRNNMKVFSCMQSMQPGVYYCKSTYSMPTA